MSWSRGDAPRCCPLWALFLFVLVGCGGEDAASSVPATPPAPGLAFSYVDVAEAMGYTLRNRTGKDGKKDFILEAMAPGIAVGDFNNDGWMDLYCPNGNDILRYDVARRQAVLIPSEQAPRNALYLSQEGKRFRETGKAAGVDDEVWSFGAIAGDIDNDGDTDIYVCNWGPNRLYLNRGDATFDEVGGGVGAAGRPGDWSTAACFVDYDGDGDLDIYVSQYANVENMLQHPEITKIGPNGEVDGRNCEWKKLKVYCGPIGLEPLNDVLFANRLVETGKLAFEDVSERAGLRFRLNAASFTEASQGPFYAFQPVAWDIDGDGRQDIFVANDNVRNSCWINRGDGTFEDRADLLGLAVGMSQFSAQASMGVAVGDVNGDSLFDLTLTEFSHDEFNLLLGERLPRGGIAFAEKAPTTGLRAMTFSQLGWGALFIDPDLDGDQDIFFACGHVFPEVDQFKGQETTYRQYNLLVLNLDQRRPKLENLGARAGPGLEIQKCSRAAAMIDFDNDGDPDIATTEMNDTPTLLRCDVVRTGGAPHWVAVRLRGKPSAKVPLDPAGAVVTVKAGDLSMQKVLLIGSSFECSEDPRLLFGLGSHDKIDSLEVLWPNGHRTRLTNLPPDRLHVITYE